MTTYIKDQDGNWIEGTPTENGQPYKEVTEFGEHESTYSKPLDSVSLSISDSGQVITIGQTANFTFSFSDTAMNLTTPVSITNRDNVHIKNISVDVANGTGTASFTPDNAIDYFITNEGVNFHKDVINKEIKLDKDFYLRVVE